VSLICPLVLSSKDYGDITKSNTKLTPCDNGQRAGRKIIKHKYVIMSNAGIKLSTDIILKNNCFEQHMYVMTFTFTSQASLSG
jgi:plasmid rolling circle replication initiator protein Rep